MQSRIVIFEVIRAWLSANLGVELGWFEYTGRYLNAANNFMQLKAL